MSNKRTRTTGAPTAAAALLALLCGASCQTYSPEPLDLDAHRAAWSSRDPAAPAVTELAQRLRAAGREAPERFDPADGVDLAEAEVLALFYNAGLRRARARLGVAAATRANAGRWEDPVFGFKGGRIVDSGKDPWLAEAAPTFTLPVSGALAAEVEERGAEELLELARVQAEEWRVRTEVRAAWAHWTTTALSIELTEELLSDFDEILAIVATLEASGELGRVQAGLFRIERLTRGAELAELRADAALAEQSLRALMGFTPSAPLVLHPGPAAITLPAGDLEPRIAQTSPSLAVARAHHAVAEAALATAIARSRPDLELAPIYANEDALSRLLLGGSLPLLLWNRNREEIARASAERDSARADFETRYEELCAELFAARIELAAVRERHDTFRDEIAPLVDEQAAAIERLAELGELQPLLVLESLSRRHAARLELVRLRLAEARVVTRIQRLVGPAPPSEPDSGRAAGESP